MQIKDIIPWARKDGAPEDAGDARAEHPVAKLQHEVEKAFQNFWSRLESMTDGIHLPWGGPRSDMVEVENAIEVSIELPGMEMKDVEVSISDDVLTVKGEKRIERQEEKKGYFLSERTYGAIYRTIPLPPGVQGDKAEATFRNGVLTIRIPVDAEARSKARRIEVKEG
ncbi:Hsp20/alpha crystallin family protein [Oceanicella actignis]|uniref:HSP20 family protein n=1 Tax=Oceanicella actignis TaxID=1189325 RepID=A0A1M7SR95_9RHOB|nr:Hsp20/alpha crystallin family protein [Oceanicella actignis]SES67508.1 HSP20 family protein [Oceanicella actignis]SHN60971.1 HSP20 family protein [Oceanicella actignis]